MRLGKPDRTIVLSSRKRQRRFPRPGEDACTPETNPARHRLVAGLGVATSLRISQKCRRWRTFSTPVPPTGVMFVRCTRGTKRQRVQYEPYSRKWNGTRGAPICPATEDRPTIAGSTVCGLWRIVLGIALRRTKCKKTFRWRCSGYCQTRRILFFTPPARFCARLRLCRRQHRRLGLLRRNLSWLLALGRIDHSPLSAGLAGRLGIG